MCCGERNALKQEKGIRRWQSSKVDINEYALELMARYFRNTLVYYKGVVEDDDYFDPIVQLCSDTLVEREILSRFDKDELFSSDVCRECSERGPNNGRKYKILETEVCFCQCDSTDSLKILWNEKKFNSRCRELLIGYDGKVS